MLQMYAFSHHFAFIDGFSAAGQSHCYNIPINYEKSHMLFIANNSMSAMFSIYFLNKLEQI